MAQMIPNYQDMTSVANESFLKPLIARYDLKNVVWPIVILEKDSIKFYLYEVNGLNKINQENDNRPISKSGLQNYFVDYTTTPRKVIPPTKLLDDFIKTEYHRSYDYILKSDKHYSVDIDYAWQISNNAWKGLELTTLWMPLANESEAERLIKMFNRRPSWRGASGAHGIQTQVKAAADLNIDYYMACINSERVSNNFVTTGNAYWFPLNDENIKRIAANEAPKNAMFGTFKDLINWL